MYVATLYQLLCVKPSGELARSPLAVIVSVLLSSDTGESNLSLSISVLSIFLSDQEQEEFFTAK